MYFKANNKQKRAPIRKATTTTASNQENKQKKCFRVEMLEPPMKFLSSSLLQF